MRASPWRWTTAVLLCTAIVAGFLTALALCAAGVGVCTDADGRAAEPRAAEPAPDETSQPYRMEVERIRVTGMDNAEIRGGGATPVDEASAETAVAGARDALVAFLNAQLLDETTRFTAEPVDRLLTDRARAVVTDEDRTALGQLDLPVDDTVAGPAAATANVLMHGSSPHIVTLAYSALLTLVHPDGASSRAQQHGTITFLPVDGRWRAEAVDVSLEISS